MPQQPTAAPIPVAFVTDVLSIGGAEAQLIDLVAALDPRRIAAHVAVLRPEGAQLDQLRVPVRVLGRGGGRGTWGPRDWIRTRAALAGYLEAGRYPAIYTTHLWSLIFSAHLKSRIQPPGPQRRPVLIATEHSYRVQPASNKILVALRRRARRRADRIVAVSEAQAAWLQEGDRHIAGMIEVIPNAIDPGRYAAAGSAVQKEVHGRLGIPAGAPVIVCVARLVPIKGLDVLIDACAAPALQGTSPGGPAQQAAHVVLVGDGPERDRLMLRAREAGIADRVHFAGAQPDPRPFLAAADVACLPSHSESQGIALLEAMAAGLPVVASRVGGIPEVVVEGRTGLLAPPGEPRELAAALAQALGDSAWRRAAGEAGRERVQRVFSIDARARRIEDLVAALVAEARRRAPNADA
jgi:glycosyltransferase involved in cell wall biosynthesis